MSVEVLKVSMAVSFDQTGDKVTFAITFANSSKSPISFKFSNTKRRAETLLLGIWDDQGNRIVPHGGLHIVPKNDFPDVHTLSPDEAWTYDLEGRVTKDGLKFLGGNFSLVPGSNYLANFRYGNTLTEKVGFKFPERGPGN